MEREVSRARRSSDTGISPRVPADPPLASTPTARGQASRRRCLCGAAAVGPHLAVHPGFSMFPHPAPSVRPRSRGCLLLPDGSKELSPPPAPPLAATLEPLNSPERMEVRRPHAQEEGAAPGGSGVETPPPSPSPSSLSGPVVLQVMSQKSGQVSVPTLSLPPTPWAACRSPRVGLITPARFSTLWGSDPPCE